MKKLKVGEAGEITVTASKVTGRVEDSEVTWRIGKDDPDPEKSREKAIREVTKYLLAKEEESRRERDTNRLKTSFSVDRDLWKRVRSYSLEHDVMIEDIIAQSLHAFLSNAKEGGT